MRQAALVSVLVLIVVALFIGQAPSQTRREPPPLVDEVDAPHFRDTSRDQPARPPSVDEMRRKYAELARHQAQRMTKAELEQAIEQMERHSQEATATERLKDAEAVLNNVVREFPETEAARRARLSLVALREDGLIPVLERSGLMEKLESYYKWPARPRPQGRTLLRDVEGPADPDF